MANPDRPGFKPVRARHGQTTWDVSFADPCLIDDAIFDDTEASALAIGTPVVATTAANVIAGALGHLQYVVPLTDEHSADAEAIAGGADEDVIKGVVVGISRIGEMTTFNTASAWGQFMAGPSNLEASSKFVTSAEVEADPDGFLVWIADAQDWVYEVQGTAAGDYRPGLGVEIVAIDDGTDEHVNTTTGQSLAAVVLEATDPQFMITNVPQYLDNDPEAANARVWVVVAPAFGMIGADGSTAAT
jgi:hypothetical protein